MMNDGLGCCLFVSDTEILVQRHSTLHVKPTLIIPRHLTPSQVSSRFVPVHNKLRPTPPLNLYRHFPVDGILGILHLLSGPYIVFVTESSSEVCTLPRITTTCNSNHSLTSSHVYCVRDVLLLSILVPKDQPLLPRELAEEDAHMLQLIQTLLTPSKSPERFYYASGSYDLTRNYQDQACYTSTIKKSRLPCSKFWWNKHMVDDFKKSKCFDWILTAINGFVGTTGTCHVPHSVHDPSVEVLLLARRSRHRQGLRFTSRGVDIKGHASNEVECEQIVLPTQRRRVITSFVQVRGSLPLKWSQEATLLAVPRISHNSTLSEECFNAHMNHLENNYGELTCVNLVSGFGVTENVEKQQHQDQQVHVKSSRGDQHWLGSEYERLFRKRANADPRRKKNRRSMYVWFDFHRECSGGKYQQLSILADKVHSSLLRHGFFSSLETVNDDLMESIAGGRGSSRKSVGKTVMQQQIGVVRTNCMDTLDRTNATQALFSCMMLLEQLGLVRNEDDDDGGGGGGGSNSFLSSSSASSSSTSSSHPHSSVSSGMSLTNTSDDNDHNLSTLLGERLNRKFRGLWLQCGDRMSLCYASSQALKRDVVLIGKCVNRWSKLKDLTLSASRYLSNNFQQGRRQDALDLFLGEYVPTVATYDKAMVRYRAGLITTWWRAGACLGTCLWIVAWLLTRSRSMAWTLLVWCVLVLFLIWATMIKGWTLRWTSHFVERPCLLIHH